MNLDEQIEKYGYYIFDTDIEARKPNKERIETQYNMVVMCNSGEATIEANMQEISIHKGECLNLVNVVFMRSISVSSDFKARILMCSREFSLDSVVGVPTEYIEMVFYKPVLKVDNPAEWALLSNFFESLYLLQQQPLTLRHNEVTGSTFRSIIILLSQLEMKRNGGSVDIKYSQSDIYFRKFVDLIYENIKSEHEVSFYAEKMNITAKYLSEISKQKSGHKAKEVISAFLTTRLKREILISGKSIKVIAYENGFADQSSMGKFFNKMTGMSPTEFKNNNI